MVRLLFSKLAGVLLSWGQLFRPFARMEIPAAAITGPPDQPKATQPARSWRPKIDWIGAILRSPKWLAACKSIFSATTSTPSKSVFFRPMLEHLEVKLAPAGDIFGASVMVLPGHAYGITAQGAEQVVVGSMTGSDGFQDAYKILVNQAAKTMVVNILPETLGMGDYIATDISPVGDTISEYFSPPIGGDHGISVFNGVPTDIGSVDGNVFDTRALTAANGGKVYGDSAGGSRAVGYDPSSGLYVQPGFPGSLLQGTVQGASSTGDVLGGFGTTPTLISVSSLVWVNGVLTIIPSTSSIETIRDVSPSGQFKFGSSAIENPVQEAEVPVATRFGPNNEKLFLRDSTGELLFGSELWGGTDNGWMVGAGPQGVFIYHESWTSVRYMHELLQTQFGITVDQLTYQFLDVRAEIQFDGENLNIVMAGETKSYAVQLRVTSVTPPTTVLTITGKETADSITFNISTIAPGVTEIVIDLRGGNDNLTLTGVAPSRPLTVRILGGIGNDTVRWLVTGGQNIRTFADLGDGNDVLLAGAARANVDFVVDGGKGNDRIQTGAGRDNVRAGDGNDLVLAGAGDDNINGGAGADLLLGEAGDDTLDGGTGFDVLSGGAGKDVFLYDLLSPPLLVDFRSGVDVRNRK